MSQIIEKSRSLLQGNLGVMIVSSGLWNLGGNMVWPFFSLYVLELGGNYVDIGLITALGSLVQVIPTFFGGYLSDRVGRRKLVYSMSFLLAFNELLTGFAPNFRFLFITSALGAIWMGLREPSFNSIVADSTDIENRALGYALWRVIPPMIGVMSPYLIGVLMDRYGVLKAMRWAYLGLFVCAFLSSTIRYRYLKETLGKTDKADQSNLSNIRQILPDFKQMFTKLPRQLWIFLSIDLVFTLGWGLTEPYFVTYAKDSVGLSGAQWGLVTTLVTVTSTFVMLYTAQLSDEQGRIKFIIPTMFMWSVTFFMYVLTGSFIQVLAVRLMISLASCIGEPAWEAMFMDYSPREFRGRFNAIAIIAWSTTWGIGNVIGGYLYQNYTSQMPFNIAGVIMIIASFIALFVVREPEKREE